MFLYPGSENDRFPSYKTRMLPSTFPYQFGFADLASRINECANSSLTAYH